MQEALLHHIWKFRLFDMKDLKTETGEPIEIIHPGKQNADSGPDFFDARISIAGTLWAGNVELHIKTSDWLKHAHQHDGAYDNVVLHVVYEDDKIPSGITSANKNYAAPVLELKPRIANEMLKRYDNLMLNPGKIPCSGSITDVDSFTITNWLERLLVERLELKTTAIADQLNQNGNNWEETFYIQLARNFGFKINALPFEMLARSLPLPYLAKHKNDLMQLEAMLFGQAGLLQGDFKDAYPKTLKKEYEFLKAKFSLQPMDAHLWKFMRLRPANFPTIRLAQFAQLIYTSSHLFSKLLEIKSVEQAYGFFDVEVTDYWKSHYTFDKPSTESSKHIGSTGIQNILINTVIPFLFSYGRQNGDKRLQNRAFDLISKIPPENNSITGKWTSLKIELHNAGQTQACIQLYNFYCSEKKCLFCAIGNKILKKI